MGLLNYSSQTMFPNSDKSQGVSLPPRREMLVQQDLDQGELEWEDGEWNFSTMQEHREFSTLDHLRSPVSVPLQARSFCSLGKCANARKEIKVCLDVPTGRQSF